MDSKYHEIGKPICIVSFKSIKILQSEFGFKISPWPDKGQTANTMAKINNRKEG